MTDHDDRLMRMATDLASTAEGAARALRRAAQRADQTAADAKRLADALRPPPDPTGEPAEVDVDF